MASGFRELVFNTQERLISPDLNRAHKFMGADVAELFRYMLDVVGQDDLESVRPTATTAPLRAEILNGFLVRPEIGTLALRVDGGCAFVMAPDGAADESAYKFVKFDPSLQPSTVFITANASGSTRIDVIEMSLSGSQLVSDSRDVFNPSTGFFTASLVTKERRAGVAFRVRQGTPGGGFPGVATGWLPLAVASVPDGTTTNDTVTFWDVRPLLRDRVQGVSLEIDSVPSSPDCTHQVYFDAATPTTVRVRGRVKAAYNGRWVGGTLYTGCPGTDAAYIETLSTAATCRDPSHSYNSFSAITYMYLLLPAGLPRWMRYTDPSFGVRVPRGTKGIAVLSNISPAGISGFPSAAIQLPTSTGLGVSTADGVCVGFWTNRSLTSGGYAYSSVGPGAFVHSRRGPDNETLCTAPTGSAVVIPAGNGILTGLTLHKYRFQPGVHYPKNARRLLLRWEATYNLQNTRNYDFAFDFVVLGGVWNDTGTIGPPGQIYAANSGRSPVCNNTATNPLPTVLAATAWIDVPTMYPDEPGSWDVYLIPYLSADVGTLLPTGVGTMVPRGWEI